ncbi:proto-oncogene c-Rel isoform X1 [Helicoverpa armigera]|uniref:proto-oncogene c-Rel isoform X1 n=1 Tax=Helicoverpa armigera TaxID=29058 RepID=UPI003083AF38
MRHPKESFNNNPSSGQKRASSAGASNVSSTSQEPRPIVVDEPAITNGSAMAPAPQSSTSGARAATEHSPSYEPDFMYVEQIPSNWSAMSPATSSSVYSPGWQPDFMSFEQPPSNSAMSPALSPSVYSPRYESDFRYMEQPFSNTSAMTPAPQPSASGVRADSVFSPGYEPDIIYVEQPFSNMSAMSSEPQPSTSGAHAASVYSPAYESDFMYVEQPPSNRSELPLAEQPSTSRGAYTGPAGYRSAMAPAPQPNARGARAPNVPRVEIIEQPARYRRFRYFTEVDSAGSIRGEHYTEEHKTYPTIRILGFRGRVIIIVCTLTKDSPGAYKVHPACLVGDNCMYHILQEEVDVTEDNCVFEFNNLRIQYVASKNVNEELQLRKKLRIDPFKQGYGHKRLSKVDLHAVRLCFHVFEKGASRELAPPVVSDIIYDSKFTGDLTIKDFCYHSGPTTGGTKIIFVSKQVSKGDIEVFFYEIENGVIVWEAPATDIRVYERTAISCLSPPYRDRIINNDVQVFYHLRRPSHNSTGTPARFTYRAEQDDEEVVRAKKRKSLLPIVREYIDWQPPVTPPQDYAMQFDQNGEPLPGPSRPRTFHSDVPASYSGVPASYSDVPASYSGVPASYSDVPASYSDVPASYSDVPASYSGVPASYSGVPASYSDVPASYSDVPASYSGVPASYSDVPASYSDVPASYSGVPASYSGAPVLNRVNSVSTHFEQLHVHPEQPESHHEQPGSQFALINENNEAADYNKQESLPSPYDNQNDETDTNDEFDLDDIYLNGYFD